jgi:hypothetical protein
VCGALCGYLVVGLIFGHLYCLIELARPHSFHGPLEVRMQLETHGERYFLLVYFSLVTLTTVGYGEIAPASELARSLAAVEAILGQFYLAVLIADLIGKRLAAGQRSTTAQPPISDGRREENRIDDV